MKNYFTIHKNKKPKNAKYSKTYTKFQLDKMEECTKFFLDEIQRIKKNVDNFNLGSDY